jgi:aspartyl-tRNA(Asn)/glutamyl-tRNA(Gln) amidotransferase subunit A
MVIQLYYNCITTILPSYYQSIMANLNSLTIKDAHKKLQDKEISSTDLVKDCIKRIEKTDKLVHAFLNTNFVQALEDAKAVDKKIKKGEHLKPLEGIPCGIKDLILTEGIITTASSKMLQNYKPLFNATVINKLKENGAIILGKQNCDAWGHGSSTENSDYGSSHNPWDLERVPGGSSGGSAASVAADQVIYSLGTDTGGSIRHPASLCGVVGLKPTYGRVSRYGAIAMGSSLDQIGPITKTVADAAEVMNVISGLDKLDSTTLPKPVPDYTKNLQQGINGMKIGVPKQAFVEGLDLQIKQLIEVAILDLAKQGADLVEID